MFKVCIIGLGYVGLPLAIECAKKGHKVLGFDIDENKIKDLNNGINYLKSETNLEKNLIKYKQNLHFSSNTESTLISKTDFIIICVPTPVDENRKPLMNYVESAASLISKHLSKQQTVVLESTVFPGTTERIVKPILEKSGLNVGIDFNLAYCPERIDPGSAKWNVSNIPRVLGAFTTKGANKAKEFYSSVIDSEIMILKSTKEAEATKIMENTFRDINIAFINEMAMSFDKMNIDIADVIKGASTKPFSFMPHFPGCGVGGHCIPVDPYYLIEDSKTRGFDHKLLSLAREINEDMPKYTISLLETELNKQSSDIKEGKIGLYGLAYKKNVDDIRESPSFKIIELLKSKNVNVSIFDPYYTNKNTHKNINSFLDDIDYLLVATNHDEITALNESIFVEKGIKLIIDGKNCLNKDNITSLQIAYKGIGR